MTPSQIKELTAQHGALLSVNLETSEGTLFQVAFKQPSDDVMELAYSKENYFARGKSFYANCKVGSDDDARLLSDTALRHKAYVAALTLDQSGKGVGELTALSVVSEA